MHCESDRVEKQNFFALKIPIAIILTFIPYGIFMCWLPFIIPGNYACKRCGREFRKAKEINWQEYERLKRNNEETY